jgi:hypothetical protein
MAFTEPPPALPPASQPVLDSQGRLTKVWYDYLVALNAYLSRMGASIP